MIQRAVSCIGVVPWRDECLAWRTGKQGNMKNNNENAGVPISSTMFPTIQSITEGVHAGIYASHRSADREMHCSCTWSMSVQGTHISGSARKA
jgi:hypothetical protein